jgi:hypothetical protein
MSLIIRNVSAVMLKNVKHRNSAPTAASPISDKTG